MYSCAIEAMLGLDSDLPERHTTDTRLGSSYIDITLGNTVGGVRLVHHTPLIVKQISHVIHHDEGTRTALRIILWQLLVMLTLVKRH
jgi:hypothetical protein